MSEFDTFTAYLSWDHDRLDNLLAKATGHWDGETPEEGQSFFKSFKTGLERHIQIEERILFPLFEARSGITNGPTMVMRDEHRRIREVLGELLTAVEGKDWDLCRRHVGRLQSVLGPHNDKEEQILYPLTDQYLAPAERAEMVRRMLPDHKK